MTRALETLIIIVRIALYHLTRKSSRTLIRCVLSVSKDMSCSETSTIGVSTRLDEEAHELQRLLLVRSKAKDDFLDHCIKEHSIENVNFLMAFVDVQRYWQVRDSEALKPPRDALPRRSTT
jgi:predicted ATP-binding protein involved in virulence